MLLESPPESGAITAMKSSSSFIDNLPWKTTNQASPSDGVSFATKSSTPEDDLNHIHYEVYTPPQPYSPPSPLDKKVEQDNEDTCRLSSLPWRDSEYETPSVSVMCSERTCPSLEIESAESEARFKALVNHPSKLDFVGDDDGYMSHAWGSHDQASGDCHAGAAVEHDPTTESQKLKVVTSISSIDRELVTDNASSRHRHVEPHRRHHYYPQHHHQHRHHHRNSPTPPPRFVLEHKDWTTEEEASWNRMEERVWKWLDQCADQDFATCTTPTSCPSSDSIWAELTSSEASQQDVNNIVSNALIAGAAQETEHEMTDEDHILLNEETICAHTLSKLRLAAINLFSDSKITSELRTGENDVDHIVADIAYTS